MSGRGRVYRVLTGFMEQPTTRKTLLLEAAFFLLAARVVLLAAPFRLIAGFFGGMRPPVIREAGGGLPADSRVPGIAWAIDRAGRHLPVEMVCLPRALAARSMLRRRGISGAIHFGVSREGGGAPGLHAWCEASGAEVTGYPEAGKCVPVGCFCW